MAVNSLDLGKQLTKVMKSASVAKVDTSPITPPNTGGGSTGMGALGTTPPTAASTKAAQAAGKTNAFDVGVSPYSGPTTVPTTASNYGFGTTPANLHTQSTISKDALVNRDLTNPVNLKITTTDGVIATKTELASKLTGFSDTKIAHMETMATAQLRKLKSVMSTPPTLKSGAVVNSVIKNLNTMVSAGKSTIGNFKGLKSTVSCKNGPGQNGSNAMVSAAVLNSVTGAGLCANPVNLLTSVKEININGYATSGEVMGSLVNAAKTNDTRSTVDKLKTLASAKRVLKAPDGNDAAITTRLTAGLMKQISTAKLTTNPVTEYLGIKSATTALDPSFGVNPDGTPDASVSKDNNYAKLVSASALKAAGISATQIPATGQPTAPTGAKLDQIATVAANVSGGAKTPSEVSVVPNTGHHRTVATTKALDARARRLTAAAKANGVI